MAEPQPSNIAEGASEEPALPTNAEDRKAAAALSSLDANAEEETGKDVDTEALGAAMKNLDVKEGKKAELAKVKVEAVDVTLLVEQLELTKFKATELLRQNDGDAVKAMSAYVTAAV
ncbi:hypothetical protein EJ08DRAFT_577717 [Tothia fuscella]|uniref:Nascent polypeptide-associated complex subunit alpha-like UBA domain-containing protein n=1 Tax=Tothia fuscella TaxID=1048955 RepID=A0A9P4U5D2_9PEZI|nr:hypothetical protein EJ08DRAFT_577717 [Tothia fuscella]